VSAESVAAALRSPELQSILIAGEEFNSSLPWLSANRRAAHIVHANRLAALGNSDAHMLWMIGLARTNFPGRTAHELRHALVARETYAEVSSRPWYYLASWFHRQGLRSLGLAQWSEPSLGAPIGLRRITAMRANG
jgi:hypothetical protein